MRYLHTAARCRYDLPNGSRLDLACGAIVGGSIAVWLVERWPDHFRAIEEERPVLTGEAPAEELLHK